MIVWQESLDTSCRQQVVYLNRGAVNLRVWHPADGTLWLVADVLDALPDKFLVMFVGRGELVPASAEYVGQWVRANRLLGVYVMPAPEQIQLHGDGKC